MVCVRDLIRGLYDVSVSAAGASHHLLSVTVSRRADLWGTVTCLLGCGLRGGAGERQVHHVHHVAQSPRHLGRQNSE